MKKVAIYIRLSVEDKNKIKKGDDSESIQNQRTMLNSYVRRQGWEIHGEYADEDISGIGEHRPSFERLLIDAKQGKFNIVICKTQSRFTRDMRVVEDILHGKFVGWNVRFIGVVDGVDTAISGGKKSRQINGLVNEWYVEALSEDLRATFKEKMKAGQFLGSYAPFGYEKSRENKHKLIIDEEASQVVKKIYKLYLEGFGTHKISKILTEEGILKPSLYKQKQDNKFSVPNLSKHNLWGHTTINRILRNDVYIGTLSQGKDTTVSYKDKTRVRKDKKDWIVIEDNHQAIIKKDDFHRVQELLDSKRRSKATKGKAHLFATKVRCINCDGTMALSTTRSRSKQYKVKEYRYLKCGNNTRGGKLICEHKNRINFMDLENYVNERFQALKNTFIDDEEAVNELMKLVDMRDHKSDRRKLNQEILNIRRDIDKNDIILTDLYIDRKRDEVTEEEYNRIRKKIRGEAELLRLREKSIKKSIEDCNKMTKQKLDIKSTVDEVWKGGLTHEIVLELINHIKIGGKGKDGKSKVKIYWNL